jgi:hypothetical protein
MSHFFEPFTPEIFKDETGLAAHENEAIYIRWVNAKINYANYLNMKAMNESLQEIIRILEENGTPK